MSRTTARLRPAIILLAALAVGLTGCSLFAPEGGDPPGNTTGGYKERTTCPNVIHNLIRSYEEMESQEYIDLLSDDFEFWLNPTDVNDPGSTLPDYWGKTEESAIAHNMLDEGSNVESISLTLTQIGTEQEIDGPNPEDPTGWSYVYQVDLYVHLPNELTYWANAAARYTFFTDPNETGPNGETLWEITKWEDIDVPSRPGAPNDFEQVSLTELKAIFQ